MNVLHLSTPTGWRGGEQQAAYLAQALQDLDVNNFMLCPEESVLMDHMKSGDIKTIPFRHAGLMQFSLAYLLRKACSSNNISLIHAHDAHAHTAAVLSATFFGNTLPIVVSRRVDFKISPNPFSRWKYNHPSVKRIICVSRAIRELTAPYLNAPSVLRVVHSGIDLSRYEGNCDEPPLRKEMGLGPDAILVGNLSALADHKDYPTWLEAARLLASRHPQLYFIIAGKGAEEEAIRSVISKNRLDERIRLIGFRNDIPSVMRSLDIFLMSSKTEGLGTILIEAMAAGVPVVATRAGGIPELVEDGVTGLLAAPGDSEGLANAVTRLLEDPDLRVRVKNNALKKAGEFSFRKTAEATLAIYREIIAC